MAVDSILERKLLELKAEIANRESELASLKAKFKKLDDARAVLVELTSAKEGAIVRMNPRHEREIGLQEAVLNFVSSSPNPDGVTIKEVTEGLRGDYADRYTNKNSYASSVYVTLKRLTQQGRTKEIETQLGKHWLVPDSTMSIFQEDR